MATTLLFFIGSVFLLFIFLPDSDDQGFKDFCGEANVLQDDLVQFYKNRKDYPAYTLDELQQRGAFDGNARARYWVHFEPFSSETSDNQIVMRMGLSPLGFLPYFCDFSWTKGELTHNHNPAFDSRSEPLEDIKERQVHLFCIDHPSSKIVSAFAWLNGREPKKPDAGLIIEFLSPGSTEQHEVEYEIWTENNSWSVKQSRTLH